MTFEPFCSSEKCSNSISTKMSILEPSCSSFTTCWCSSAFCSSRTYWSAVLPQLSLLAETLWVLALLQPQHHRLNGMNNAKHLWSRHQPCTLLVADLSPWVLHALRHKKGLDLGRCTSPGSALHDWILERGRPQWIFRVHQRHGWNRRKFKIIENSNCIPCSTSNTMSRNTHSDRFYIHSLSATYLWSIVYQL